MLGALFAIALSSGLQAPAAARGVVLAQANPGPTKTGMYIVDLNCPAKDGDLIVMQMDGEGEKRRTKGKVVGDRIVDFTIHSAIKNSEFEIIFPTGNQFTAEQRARVRKGVHRLLSGVYLDACLNRGGKREEFMAQVKANKARLTASAVK